MTTRTFQFNGIKDSDADKLSVYDPSQGKQVILKKGEAFRTDNKALADALAEQAGVEEVGEKPEDKTSRKNDRA